MSQWAEVRQMHVVDGVPKKQIAERLGLDIKTVRRAVAQATAPARRAVSRPRPDGQGRAAALAVAAGDRAVTTAPRGRRVSYSQPVSENSPKNQLFYGDNLDVLWRHVADESVDLVYLDPGGRIYRLDSLINPNHNRPNLTYEFLGVTRVWRWTKERMRRAYDSGVVVQTGPGRVPQLKRYLDEQRGRPLGDVWTDIPPINSRAQERLGYPTQKPEALMDRLIGMSSNEGDTILDPFCGCGTTIASAQRLNRRWIGIDVTNLAITLICAEWSNASRPRWAFC